MTDRIVLDIECYPNYFLIAFKSISTGTVKSFEMTSVKPLNRRVIMKIMSGNTTVGFNSNSYDIPMLTAAMAGWDNDRLKKLSDTIITRGLLAWQTCKEFDLETPTSWDHIDIINIPIGVSSLKIYGGRLHCKRMQDLPYEHTTRLTDEQMRNVASYCVNDLDTTIELYKAVEKEVALRESMSSQYGVDLRSKSDAQIAEAVIKSELTKITKRNYYKPDLAKGFTFKYKPQPDIRFTTDELSGVYRRILDHTFTLTAAGQPELPAWLKKELIIIGGNRYQFGIGGLHSCEKSRTIITDDNIGLADFDVASYYPSIILNQKLFPKQMGEKFLDVYQSIVNRRLEAKRSGNKTVADTLKIVVNGSFGKFGSKYSALYSPDLLAQVTISGQLYLLMLIEQLEAEGFSVVSANTDGIVVQFDRKRDNRMQEIVFDWMLTTGLELERNDYRALHSMDVNGYLAIKPNGTIKGKKIFACVDSDKSGKIVYKKGLAKNPDRSIVYRAVAQYLATGVPIEDTIRQCDDVREFVTVRKVQGGAVWMGEELGKSIRYYRSNTVPPEVCIHYRGNGNKVPLSDACRPLMELPESLPTDIDYDYYINCSNEVLRGIGL